jgi:4-diphosphocytidyl-2-C-methyl-D-erythritol kinase
VPAKINLHLGVGRLRGDGFHDLVSVFHAVSLYDTVTARPAARPRLTVTGPGARAVPAGGDNLAVRAAVLLGERLGAEARVHLHIDKRIPVAGGMAGGSADAAAALVACARLYGADAGHPAVAACAAALGSDVPFALLGRNALGTGRGERLTPLPAGGVFDWVFAQASAGLSTPVVFAEFDRTAGGLPRTAAPGAFAAVLAAGDAAALAPLLRNDLQAAALRLRPELGAVLRLGERAGALRGLLCGSGPTCAFLVENAARAAQVSAALRGSGQCAAVHTARGPAPGATITDPEPDPGPDPGPGPGARPGRRAAAQPAGPVPGGAP